MFQKPMASLISVDEAHVNSQWHFKALNACQFFVGIAELMYSYCWRLVNKALYLAHPPMYTYANIHARKYPNAICKSERIPLDAIFV